MSAIEPSSPIGVSWRMRDHEARLLADSLRTSRLTVLYAGSGASRTALLKEGVLPFLGRREADPSIDAFLEDRVVMPFIDRRHAEGAGSVERVVFYGGDGDDPLAVLVATVRAATPGHVAAALPDLGLADLIETVCERLDARLLIVFDAVERLFTDTSATAFDRFAEGLSQALTRPSLAVNVLIAVDDRRDDRLEALRRRIPGFDDSTVRLLGFDGDAAPSALRAAPAGRILAPRPAVEDAFRPPTLQEVVEPAARPPREPPVVAVRPPEPRRPRPPKKPVAPQLPMQTDGVYAFIESTLSQTAKLSEPWQESEHPPAPPPGGSVRQRRPAAPPIGFRGATSTSPGDSAAGTAPKVQTAHDARLHRVKAWWRKVFRGR